MKIVYNDEPVEVSMSLSNTEDGTSMCLRLSKKKVNEDGCVVDDILFTEIISPQTQDSRELGYIQSLKDATQSYFNG